MRHKNGFSLLELVIVIAIILIIAAIAIPNLLRARMSANESSAASAVRSITVAEISYFSNYPTIGYSAQLINLGRTIPCNPIPTRACLLDDNLATAGPGTPGHSGYQFTAVGISTGGSPLNDSFVAGGTPLTPSRTGTRDFCAVADGVLHSQITAGGPPPNSVAACTAYAIAQ